MDRDPIILAAAKYYGIPENERLKVRMTDKRSGGRKVEVVEFLIPCHRFNEWREHHSQAISTNFTHHQTYYTTAKKEEEQEEEGEGTYGAEKKKTGSKKVARKRRRGTETESIDVDGVENSGLGLENASGETKIAVKRQRTTGVKIKTTPGAEDCVMPNGEGEVKSDVALLTAAGVKNECESGMKTETERGVKTESGVMTENEGALETADGVKVKNETPFKFEEENPGGFIRRQFNCQRSGVHTVDPKKAKGGVSQNHE